MLRLNPNSIPSRVGLAEAWGQLNEPEITEYNVSQALEMLKRNGATYTHNFKYCQELMAWACRKTCT